MSLNVCRTVGTQCSRCWQVEGVLCDGNRNMALPLLRWSWRRPPVGLSAYLKCNSVAKIRNQSFVERQGSSACDVSGVRYCSSDREGRTHTRKVVVVGIPNPFIWFRTKFCFFLIRAYFDKDFSIEEFTDGAKQVN